MTIAGELAQLRAEFDSLPDGFARYSYLVELAALLPPAPETLHTPAHLYRGCQSQVWLRARVEYGLVRLELDSDTLLIRGVLYLFFALLDGRPAEEVRLAQFDLLRELPIGEHFASQRAAGVAGLLPELRRQLPKMGA